MMDLDAILAGRHSLDDSLRQVIENAFGARGKKAIAALDAGMVRKYHDFFVVEGRTAEYVVDEDFCTCSDFMYRHRTCWHLIAVRIARVTGTFEQVEDWYVDRMK
jgi:predicted nucleic acid-binding Zn finger protein